jgi:hypothetical protein
MNTPKVIPEVKWIETKVSAGEQSYWVKASGGPGQWIFWTKATSGDSIWEDEPSTPQLEAEANIEWFKLKSSQSTSQPKEQHLAH